MSYRIQYGSRVTKRYLNEQRLSAKVILSAVFVACICCVIAFAAFRYREMLWRWFLPGDPEVTQAALSTFGRNVREGIPISDAVNIFCREILKGAMY